MLDAILVAWAVGATVAAGVAVSLLNASERRLAIAIEDERRAAAWAGYLSSKFQQRSEVGERIGKSQEGERAGKNEHQD